MSWGERTVEVPWFLAKDLGKTILDVGSAESCYVNELLDKGAERLVLNDVRLFSTHPGDNRVTCVVGDVRLFSKEQIGTFDTVLCISTLEHMALDAYGQKKDYKGPNPIDTQLQILKHISSFISEEGQLILTIPYGKYEHGGWVIVYSKEDIEKIRKMFKIEEETYFTLTNRENDIWVKCDQKACPPKGMDHYNGGMRATSVACFVIKGTL